LDIDGDVVTESVSVVAGGMKQAAEIVAQFAYF
jgi:hypothetical protein